MNTTSKLLIVLAIVAVIGISCIAICFTCTNRDKYNKSNEEYHADHDKHDNDKPNEEALSQSERRRREVDYGKNVGEWHSDSDARMKIKIWKAMYQDWARLADALDIKYHHTCGNLIGIVRDGDLMPWDDDMDVSVCNEDLDKLILYASSSHEGMEPAKFRSERGSKFFRGYDSLPVPGGRFTIAACLPEHMVQATYVPPEDSPTFTPEMRAFFYKNNKHNLWHIDIVSSITGEAVPFWRNTAYTERTPCKMGDIQTWCPKDSKNYINTLYGNNWNVRPYCKDNASNEWLKKETPALIPNDYSCLHDEKDSA